MKARKLAESSTFSEVRDSTSSQTTASPGRPCGGLLGRWRRPLRSAESMSSIAIEPSVSMSSSVGRETITLASSRATSQRITSPSGLLRRALEQDHVDRPTSSGSSSSSASLPVARGHDDPQVDHGQTLPRRELPATTWPRAHRLPPASAPDEPDAAGRLLHRGRTSSATSRPPRRPGSRSSGSPSTSTASPRRSRSGITRSGSSNARDDLGAVLRVRALDPAAARDRDGLRPRARGSRSPRCSIAHDFDYVVGSVHFIARQGGRSTTSTTSGRQPATPDRVWAALLRDPGRGGPHRALRHPRPPRPGQGLGRGPAGARARSALLLRARSSRRSPRPGSRSRSRRRAAQARRRALPGRRVRRDVRRRGRRVRALLRCARPRARRLRIRSGGGDDARLGGRGALRVRAPRAARGAAIG